MSFSEIRTALASSMSSINGLRTSATIPDAPRPPLAVVIPESITYDLNANRGADRYLFNVTVIVGRADDRAAQNNLDQYVVGTNSIKTAIEKDRTLGGKVDTCRVMDMRNYSSLAVGDVLYLAAQFTVEVVA
jgi:hypothetical protein